jgi:outer membrane protein assembly factor BamB
VKAPETVRLPAPRAAGETMRVEVAKDTHPAMSAAPVELPPGTWEPPPVRHPGAAAGPEDADHLAAPKRRARRARWTVAGLAVLVGAFAGIGLWVVNNVTGQSEDKRSAQAQEAYDKKDFVESERLFGELEKDFPGSAMQAHYQFFKELSGARKPIYQLPESPRATRQAYQRLLRFVDAHSKSELLKKDDIADSFYKLVEQMTDWAEREADASMLALARETLARARGDGDGSDRYRVAKGHIEQAVEVIRRGAIQQRLIEGMDVLTRRPSGDMIRRAGELIRQAEQQRGGIRDDPQVIDGLNRLAEAHRREVKYKAVRKPPRSERPAEDSEPSLLIAPRTGAGFQPWPGERPVLALARGVLYALRPHNGKILWATRVGIDTTVLPARIPAHKTVPELILALSSDTRTLSALDALDGRTVWQHTLSAACLARPTILGTRLYVPCYNGRVEEIEAAGGKLTGYFDLGQPLTLAGVYDEDTGLLYVAADSSCVFALDLARHRCAGVLYSGHSSGALRCPPMILRWPDVPADAPRSPSAPRSCLVLSEADGLDATELRAFPLPLPRPNAAPVRLGKTLPGKLDGPPLLFPNQAPLPLRLRARGWTWFPPRQDEEKLAVASDAGILAIFGIKQRNNDDQPLFPLSDAGFVLGKPGNAPRERAELVHLDESNFWVLAGGGLHRAEISLGPAGWRVHELWGNPIPLGSPLHASQVDAERGLLFLVTQPDGGQTCLASAVRAEAAGSDPDKVRWQTQLGLVSRGGLEVLQGSVLALDHRGGFFRFNPTRYRPDARAAWLIHEERAESPLGAGARPLRLLPVAGGACAVIAMGRKEDANLIIRLFNAATGKIADHRCLLTSPVAGLPGAWPDHLVFPMNSGILARKQLAEAPAVEGPNWRDQRADENSVGYVLPLEASDFLVTDGSRGLAQYSWPMNDRNWQLKGQVKLAARIVTAPVVIPDGKNEVLIFAADVENYVTVLRKAMGSGDFETVQRIPAGGKITAGPFRLGQRVACVVEQRRLVLFDAAQNKPVWSFPAGAPILGSPAEVAGLLVVADLEGRFVGLDPATGKPRGKGYRLNANVAPAAAPVPFGPDRVFAPLTDGTVLLLALDRLK